MSHEARRGSVAQMQGVMHDTCNTANKTARLAKSLRGTSGQLYYGYDEWEARAEEYRPWFDFLCGNHTRNLPMDEFNKLYEAYLRLKLGDDLIRGIDARVRVTHKS
jgi:hypothetical protein